MFQHVNTYAGDPILTLNQAFMNDSRQSKANLSIGVYLDEAGRLPIMEAVLKAETHLLSQVGARPYLPMEGASGYRAQAQYLLFGEKHEAVVDERIATAQTVGGSGALKVGAEFLKTYFGNAQLWVSDPTWDNHHAIFSSAGFKVNSYPYYSHETQQVDFSRMKAALEALPAGDIVVLHACCHNPTGADLSQQQWRELAAIFRNHSLIPFFDIAYQGFGEGIDEDAFAIRHFASEGIPFLAASSFSKNFSLYGERCGALHVICPDVCQKERVLGQLKAVVRNNYSSPPVHGSSIISMILEKQSLRALWTDELNAMRFRIRTMRESLHANLSERRPDRNFDYLLKQKGMFSFTGLTPQQVEMLRREFAVYLVGSGRICMAALTQQTLASVTDAMTKIVD